MTTFPLWSVRKPVSWFPEAPEDIFSNKNVAFPVVGNRTNGKYSHWRNRNRWRFAPFALKLKQNQTVVIDHPNRCRYIFCQSFDQLSGWAAVNPVVDPVVDPVVGSPVQFKRNEFRSWKYQNAFDLRIVGALRFVSRHRRILLRWFSRCRAASHKLLRFCWVF